MKKLKFAVVVVDDREVLVPTPHGEKTMLKRRAAAKVARRARATNFRRAMVARHQRQKRRRQGR